MASSSSKNLFSPSFLVIHSALAFGVGIAFAILGSPPPPSLLPVTIAIGIAGILTLRLSTKLSHFLTIAFLLLTGLYHGSASLSAPKASHHIANLISTQKEVTLIGVVAKSPEYSRDRSTLIIESRAIYIPDDNDLAFEEDHPLLAFQKASGLVKLSMRNRPADMLHPGDQILVRAKISPPRGFHNPGGFDHARFLATKGIFASGWVGSGQAIIKIEGQPTATKSFYYFPERLRSHLISFLNTNLLEKHSALYRALITGDRAGLPPKLVELFRSLGIVHLLAISGLHMALLAGGVMGISYWFLQRSEKILLNWPAKKIAACAAITPLILYCLVAGFQTPALRSLLMILVFISALLSDRQWHGLTNISLAALLILIFNPLAITTVSFQLSFAAVTGIILILPKARHFFAQEGHNNTKNMLIRYAAGSFLVSFAASLATLPLLLYHFNRFALSGPLATIIIEPFLCMWALAWGLPASIFAPLFPDFAILLFKIGGLGLDATLFLAAKLQPLARSLWLPSPSLFQIALFYCGLLFFINTEKMALRLTAAFCCLIFFVVPHSQPATDQATILDVGQGNCTLIETTKGEIIVVDAGGPRSPSFDIGRQVIAPVLWSKGIREIDLLVLSHPDQDHYSGAAFLLEVFSPKALWIPTKDARDPGWLKMLKAAEKAESSIHIPHQGESYPLANGSQLTCLSDLHQTAQKKQNNRSLVVKFISENHSLLMPGDIEKEAEKYLLNQKIDIDSDIVIAPHHGSSSSSSKDFVDQISPHTVIFSASRFKRNLYPDNAVQARYSEIGATQILTSEAGAITIHFTPRGVKTTSLK